MLSYGIIAKDLAQFSIGNPKKKREKEMSEFNGERCKIRNWEEEICI